MQRTCCYVEPNTSVGARQENDNNAHTVYELYGKTADLQLFYERIFPRQKGSCNAAFILRRNFYRFNRGVRRKKDGIQRRGGTVCYGTAKLPFAECKNHFATSVGKGKGLFDKSVYRNIHCNNSNLVLENL